MNDKKIIEEIEKRLKLVKFGSVGVVLTVHNGQVVKIEYQTNEKEITE